MKTLYLVFFLIVVIPTSRGQSPFKDMQTADLLIIESGIISELVLRLSENKEPLLSIDRDLSTMKALGFEKNTYKNSSLKAHKSSNGLLYSTGAIALSNQFFYNDNPRTGYIMLEALLINDVLNLLAKKFIKRNRPFVYNQKIEKNNCHCKKYDYLNPDARMSFYSGHTANVTAFSFLSASLFSHYNPESNLRKPLWMAAGMASVLTGYLRIRAGKHFPTDVFTGFLAGGAIGFLVPRWNRSEEFNAKDSNYWQDLAWGTGAGALLALILKAMPPSKHNDCLLSTTHKSKKLLNNIDFSVAASGFSLRIHI